MTHAYCLLHSTGTTTIAMSSSTTSGATGSRRRRRRRVFGLRFLGRSFRLFGGSDDVTANEGGTVPPTRRGARGQE